MRTRILIPFLAWASCQVLFAAQPLSHAMPEGPLVYGELNGLGPKLLQLRDSEYFQLLMDSPQMTEAKAQPDYRKAMAAKTLAEGFLGMDLWTLSEGLLTEMAFGLYPQDEGEPAPLLIARMGDPVTWAKVRQRLDPIFVLAEEEVERETRGELEYVQLEELRFVMHKDWLVASTKAGLLDSAVAGLTGKKEGTGSGKELSKKMDEAMGANRMLRVWADLATFRDSTGERMNVPEKYDDGFAALMFSGIIELALKSDFAGLALDLDDKGMKLTSFIDGEAKKLGDKFGWFFSDANTPGTQDLPAVKGLMGGFTIHRDVANWYDKREELLEERLLPEFDKFESDVGTLFPGRSVAKDIIPTFGKTFTVLAAEQSFDYLGGAEPGIKLPGFAAIFDLNKPEDANMFQLLFQTVVTITNFAGAEEGKMMRGPSVMTAVVHDGTPISTIQFLQKPKGERLHISYNFMPSSATVNGRFIFSSSLPLCKALVDQLKKPKNTERANHNFNFELHPNALVPLVKANRRALVAQNIQEGKTPDEAREEIDMLQTVLSYLKGIRLETSVKEKGFQIELAGEWN